ncbi:membrane protein FxsA [Sporosarcina sp. P21c]|uniref:FxsA family protein n=1 Tax=Sporosarcina TaxID=1569 RepID=UPI000A156FFD|nr:MULTISPECIES: FxsA family protein [Sporosarcina]ARJ37996.1 exclusion suppressor FxsA [Sporosarcina ureae]PIC67690.1 membrane protein FxsA [Sporosarcina sp. P16a]PIC83682.1 membrane protein FxsA [Sporosarcina sp. P1]PIC90549.1 membrane protein FxsA [Sporosarcina sp. P21c]PIC93315.1 membrane protein FxsA [Sporosarcina sp. P25]
MKWLVALFIIVPTTELALLMVSGKTLGILPTILIIVVTGVGGAYLAKKQGLRAWRDLQVRMANRETPGKALVDSVCILLGGLLLLIPGFITDIIGFVLLFSGPRKILYPFIVKWIYNKIRNGQIRVM